MDTNPFRRAIRVYRNEGLLTLAVRTWKFWWHSLYPYLAFTVLNTIRPKVHTLRYSAPSKPYQVIWIDPSQIGLYKQEMTYKKGLARVKSGNWDRHTKSLEKHRTHRGLKQRFEEDLDWQETDYIPKDKELRAKWDDTEEFISKKCQYIDSLHDEIKKEGYSPNFSGNTNTPPREKVPTRDLEPMVFIDRNGEFILHEGFHRITIAQILDVEQIPVYVIARHIEWQQIRDEIATTNSLGSLSERAKSHLDHPDFNDIEKPMS